jgi:putative intracellular protease/amidase
MALQAGDLVVVPGLADSTLPPTASTDYPEFYAWLRSLPERGVGLCSVCTGAFLLGAAGLLAGRACTTHWQQVGALQQAFPESRGSPTGSLCTTAACTPALEYHTGRTQCKGPKPVLIPSVVREVRLCKGTFPRNQ